MEVETVRVRRLLSCLLQQFQTFTESFVIAGVAKWWTARDFNISTKHGCDKVVRAVFVQNGFEFGLELQDNGVLVIRIDFLDISMHLALK